MPPSRFRSKLVSQKPRRRRFLAVSDQHAMRRSRREKVMRAERCCFVGGKKREKETKRGPRLWKVKSWILSRKSSPPPKSTTPPTTTLNSGEEAGRPLAIFNRFCIKWLVRQNASSVTQWMRRKAPWSESRQSLVYLSARLCCSYGFLLSMIITPFFLRFSVCE